MNQNVKNSLNGLNCLERTILKELIINPRKTITNISKSINKTRTTTSKHLKNLLDNNKIKFFTTINLNSLDVEFFLIRIHIRRLIDAEYFTKLFQQCPKAIFSLYSQTYNNFVVLLYDEKVGLVKPNFIYCMHLIHRIQSDERVVNCEVESLCDLISPKFIPIDKRVFLKNDNSPPCGERCDHCVNYTSTCAGCPCTKYYIGQFTF